MSIELNANNAKIVARKVMKARDMHIYKNFTPVESNYIIYKGDNNRHIINMSDCGLLTVKEVKQDNKWVIEAFKIFKGKVDKVEQKFIEVIAGLTK